VIAVARHNPAFFLAALLVFSGGARLAAQDHTRGSGASPTFSFLPPGARSMGMGGTFIGIADDATAAEANPAGLTILSRPEVSAHFRLGSFQREFPNYFDVPQSIDTFGASSTSPSFFSFVFPFERFALSAYYHQQSNFATDVRLAGLLDIGGVDPFLVISEDQEFLDVLSDNIGLSGAYRLGSLISLGGSVRFTRVKLQSSTGFTLRSTQFPDEVYVGFEDGSAGEDRKVTFNLGVLVNSNGKISGGMTFKQGADLEFGFENRTRQCLPCSTLPDGSIAPPVTTVDLGRRGFSIPATLGFGLAVRPSDRWVFGVDVSRIDYSVNAVTGLAAFSEGGIEPVEDGTEIHFGAEYTWLRGTTPIPLRFGAYFEPDHDGIADVDSAQHHLTFGAGVVFSERFQFDGAVNVAENVQEALFSFVYRMR